MEKKKQLIAYYEQTGYRDYPEDTWEEASIVQNAHDVFEFMKLCHLRDARNRNDSPIVSCWNRWVSFKTQDYVEVDGVKFFNPTQNSCEAPEYYKTAQEKYKNWEIKLKETITKKRERDKKREQDRKDERDFERLKQKFS